MKKASPRISESGIAHNNGGYTKHRIYFILRIVLFVVLLLISFLAINIQTSIVDISTITEKGNNSSKISFMIAAFRSVLGPIQPFQILVGILLIWLYYRAFLRKESVLSITALITGGIFSLFLLVGMSFSEYNDFSFILKNGYQLIIAFTDFIGYWGIFYVCIRELILKLDALNLSQHKFTGILEKINRHIFLVSFIAMLVCWIPVWIVCFPGSITYDGWYQLNQFYDIVPFTTHHPVSSTLITGAIVRFGELIGGTNFGVALFILFQSVFCAIIYSQICSYIRKKGMPLPLTFGCILFFALVPCWAEYAQVIVKDTLFAGLFAWFVLEYIKCLLGDDGKYGIPKLALTAALVCLFRNEGILIAIPALLVLLFLFKTKWRGILISMIAVLVVSISINNILPNATGISSDNTAESMNIPFLQIARYVRDYGDELTEEEAQIIDAILDFEHLTENYNPELSDSVKQTYRTDATEEDWSAFWKLWGEKLLEHPLVYAEAAMNQIYGYIDPFAESNYTYNKTLNFYIQGNMTSEENEPTYASYVFSDSIRDGAKQYASIWQQIPVLNLFVSCGSYVWAGILLLALVLRKKDWRCAWVFLIPTINILVCFLSPVNGYLRYMLPVMACMPMYVFLGLRQYLQPSQAEQDAMTNLPPLKDVTKFTRNQ